MPYAAELAPRGRVPWAVGGVLVVVLPGLGLVGYTLPTAAAVAAEGVECAVLDVPGFGSAQPRTAAPELFSIASVAAEWVLRSGRWPALGSTWCG